MNQEQEDAKTGSTPAVAKRYALPIFFALAYALSWWPSLIEAHGILPLGPLVAALILLAVLEGKSGLRTFIGRILHWRVGIRWYVLVLGLPLLIAAVAVGLNLALGATISATSEFPAWPSLVARSLFIFAFIGLGEEPAWRGYALPRLMVGRSPLAAGLLLAPLHIVWHWPLFGLEYNLRNGVPWALGVTAFAVLTTWLYLHTEGSLLLPALFHTSVNSSAILFRVFSGDDSLWLRWLWGGLWVVAGLLVILATGWNLSRKPVPTEGN